METKKRVFPSLFRGMGWKSITADDTFWRELDKILGGSGTGDRRQFLKKAGVAATGLYAAVNGLQYTDAILAENRYTVNRSGAVTEISGDAERYTVILSGHNRRGPEKLPGDVDAVFLEVGADPLHRSQYSEEELADIEETIKASDLDTFAEWRQSQLDDRIQQFTDTASAQYDEEYTELLSTLAHRDVPVFFPDVRPRGPSVDIPVVGEYFSSSGAIPLLLFAELGVIGAEAYTGSKLVNHAVTEIAADDTWNAVYDELRSGEFGDAAAAAGEDPGPIAQYTALLGIGKWLLTPVTAAVFRLIGDAVPGFEEPSATYKSMSDQMHPEDMPFSENLRATITAQKMWQMSAVLRERGDVEQPHIAVMYGHQHGGVMADALTMSSRERLQYLEQWDTVWEPVMETAAIPTVLEYRERGGEWRFERSWEMPELSDLTA